MALTILELTKTYGNCKETIIFDNVRSIESGAPGETSIIFDDNHSIAVTETREEITAMLRGEKKKTAANEILSMDVSNYELSLRTANILNAYGIKTFEDLVSRTELDLLKLANCGAKSVKEIKKVLSEFGLELAK